MKRVIVVVTDWGFFLLACVLLIFGFWTLVEGQGKLIKAYDQCRVASAQPTVFVLNKSMEWYYGMESRANTSAADGRQASSD